MAASLSFLPAAIRGWCCQKRSSSDVLSFPFLSDWLHIVCFFSCQDTELFEIIEKLQVSFSMIHLMQCLSGRALLSSFSCPSGQQDRWAALWIPTAPEGYWKVPDSSWSLDRLSRVWSFHNKWDVFPPNSRSLSVAPFVSVSAFDRRCRPAPHPPFRVRRLLDWPPAGEACRCESSFLPPWTPRGELWHHGKRWRSQNLPGVFSFSSKTTFSEGTSFESNDTHVFFFFPPLSTTIHSQLQTHLWGHWFCLCAWRKRKIR